MTRPLPSIHALDTLTADTLADLRARLDAAGFGEDTLADGESIAQGLLEPLRMPLLHDAWERQPTAARDLARLFVFDGEVSTARVAQALGPALLASLTSAGVIEAAGESVRCPFRLMPVLGLWVLGDDLHRGGEAVMGPGPTTHRLAQTIPAEAPARVLDVGCGAGTLALIAAHRGATHAVGVDISDRAIELARFNARLNALDARFAVSDLFGAVTGERFDLVISQPAFIARAPDVAASTFAHGGPMGDELVMRLFADLPTHLEIGGRAIVLMESAVRREATLQARLRAALGDSPTDLVVLAAKAEGPDQFSAAYASLVDPTLGAAWRDAMVRYRGHLRAMGVEEFTHALAMVLAPTPGQAEARFTITLPVRGMRGFDDAALVQLQRALDLATRDDAAVLAAAVRAPVDAVYVEERERPDSSLQPRWVVRFSRTLHADRELSEATWVLLGLLDGAASVTDAVEGYAAACGAAPDEVRGEVLGFVRESLARGLLVAG